MKWLEGKRLIAVIGLYALDTVLWAMSFIYKTEHGPKDVLHYAALLVFGMVIPVLVAREITTLLRGRSDLTKRQANIPFAVMMIGWVLLGYTVRF